MMVNMFKKFRKKPTLYIPSKNCKIMQLDFHIVDYDYYRFKAKHKYGSQLFSPKTLNVGDIGVIKISEGDFKNVIGVCIDAKIDNVHSVCSYVFQLYMMVPEIHHKEGRDIYFNLSIKDFDNRDDNTNLINEIMKSLEIHAASNIYNVKRL